MNVHFTDLKAWAPTLRIDASGNTPYRLDNCYQRTTLGYAASYSRFEFTLNSSWFSGVAVGNGTMIIDVDGGVATITPGGGPTPFMFDNLGQYAHTISITEAALLGVPDNSTPPTGTFLNSLYFPKSAPFSITSYSPPARRMVILHDSNVADGVLSWALQIRNLGTYPGRITCAGWGARSLYNDLNDIPSLVNAMAAACDGTVRNDFILELGAADAISGFVQGWYNHYTALATALFNGLSAKGIPGLRLWWLNPVPYYGVVADSAYVVIRSFGGQLPPGVQVIDGLGMGLTSADFFPDGIHLMSNGVIIVAPAVVTALG